MKNYDIVYSAPKKGRDEIEDIIKGRSPGHLKGISGEYNGLEFWSLMSVFNYQLILWL